MPKKTSEQDIITVQNIDLDCDEVDPETGISHREYFQVKWDGVPHRIKPGATRNMPRYLAEHYAKHLTDHLLLRKEKEEKRTNLMNNSVEREKIKGQIMIGVDEFFVQDEDDIRSEKVEEPVSAREPAEKATVTSPIDIPTPKEKEQAEVKAKPTRKSLVAECETLGIEVSNNDKVDDLIEKIAKF